MMGRACVAAVQREVRQPINASRGQAALYPHVRAASRCMTGAAPDLPQGWEWAHYFSIVVRHQRLHN